MIKPGLAVLAVISAFNAHSVTYGTDNRTDPFEVRTEKFKAWAKTTAAMVPIKNINIRGNTAELIGGPLSSFIPGGGFEVPICKKERFSHQPVVSHCSGFLVAPNIIATAGHCMNSIDACSGSKWVFDYAVEDRYQRAISVPKENVYSCKRLIAGAYSMIEDYALIELDRMVPRTPAKIVKTDPGVNTPLLMIGHPTNLPQKITDKGRLMAKLKNNTYKTDFDAFGGNSGSAVFRRDTGEIVGILVAGKTDYKVNSQLKCLEVNKERPKDGGEKVSSFKQFVKYLR